MNDPMRSFAKQLHERPRGLLVAVANVQSSDFGYRPRNTRRCIWSYKAQEPLCVVSEGWPTEKVLIETKSDIVPKCSGGGVSTNGLDCCKQPDTAVRRMAVRRSSALQLKSRSLAGANDL